MAEPPTKVTSLEDVQLWIAAHDAVEGPRLKAQKDWNKEVEKEFMTFRTRLSALERRVLAMAAAAAAFGGFFGQFLAPAFRGG